MPATWTRLRNGDWGIRTPGRPVHGDRVEVEKRDGTTQAVTVERVLWQGNDVALCTVVARETNAHNASRRRARPIRRDYDHHDDANFCGFPCPVTGRKCCPENGPCIDCH